jgi:subtilisin family serine protease
MATPHVSGVAALIIEANGHRLTPSQVESVLKRSADDLGKPGRDEWYGRGRVNAAQAVQ